MTAIFKRELKSYLTSMVGYLFIIFCPGADRNLLFPHISFQAAIQNLKLP